MEQVEELCEAIAIIDRGRVVVRGEVREVKRAMGRQVVRFATGGGQGIDWVTTLDGVSISARRADYVELTVPSGTDPQVILRAALERGEQVTRFELGDPSLEEVFIEHVGRPADEEERHLADSAHAEGAAGATAEPGVTQDR
jgi:ABC-2 type transport system ATP-binding protein